MSTETNKAIILRMVEQVWNKGRVDLVEEFFTEDCVHHIAGQPTQAGTDFVRQGVTGSRAGLPDFRLTVDELLGEGDRLAARWTTTGTHEGNYVGIPPTGKKVSHGGTTFYRLENGRIVELWFLADMLGVMQQLGVIPAPEAH
jgi:steroid delta-isomerase-like uncharacterized protein